MSAPTWIHAIGVTPELAAQIEATLRACSTVPSADELRSRVRGIDPDVDHFLVMLHRVALGHRTSVDGSNPRKSTEAPTDSNQQMTPAEAAPLLNIEPPAIRLALREHRLEGNQDQYGRWWTTRSAVELFKKRRSA